MNLTIVPIVQAIAFIAVILAVEGLYLFLRSNDRRERAVNRRMKIAAERNERVLNPELFRKAVEGGRLSALVSGVLPGFKRLVRLSAVAMTPAQYFAMMIGVTVAMLLLSIVALRAPALSGIIIAGVFGFALPYLILKILAGRREKKFNDQLPTSIDIMVRGLQAGHPVPVAIEMVAREIEDPIGSEFGHALDEMNYGQDRGAALRSISTRFKSPEYRFLVSSIEMQKETGGNLAEILSNLSKVIRERSTMRKKIVAMSAEGRITCFVVGGLPFALVLVIMALNPSFFTDVVEDVLFWPMIGGGFILWAIGITWIWRMVNFKF
ncbi:MAG: type II secretion system F family protein [Parvularculaceae bacterium]|nr:type II secretion system F family protein [Parvularculaceae bacterium]